LIVEMVYRPLTHSSTAKAVPARRSAVFGFLSLWKFRHVGVVSCVGGWIVFFPLYPLKKIHISLKGTAGNSRC
jgi:hypothetical protein